MHWHFWLVGIGMIIVGIWCLSVPSDDLWRRHERNLLARGLAPQRNASWERIQRNTSWTLLGFGIAMLLFLVVGSALTGSQPSGVSIGNRQLTQAEWDSCGREYTTCLMQYSN